MLRWGPSRPRSDAECIDEINILLSSEYIEGNVYFIFIKYVSLWNNANFTKALKLADRLSIEYGVEEMGGVDSPQRLEPQFLLQIGCHQN